MLSKRSRTKTKVYTFCMISLTQNSRKCEVTDSDRKFSSRLGLDWCWAGCDENEQGVGRKGHNESFFIINSSIILITVMTSWIYTYVKTSKCTLYMQFIVCQIYLNKAVFFEGFLFCFIFLISKIQPFLTTSTASHSDPKATATWMPHSVCPSPAEISPVPEYSILSAADAVVPAHRSTHPPPATLLIGWWQFTAAPLPETCSWLSHVTLPGRLQLHPRDTDSQWLLNIGIQKSSPLAPRADDSCCRAPPPRVRPKLDYLQPHPCSASSFLS